MARRGFRRKEWAEDMVFFDFLIDGSAESEQSLTKQTTLKKPWIFNMIWDSGLKIMFDACFIRIYSLPISVKHPFGQNSRVFMALGLPVG